MSHRATPCLLIGLLRLLVTVVVFDSEGEWPVAQTRVGEAQRQEIVDRIMEALHTQQTTLQRFRMRIESKEFSFDEEQGGFQEQETRVIDMRRLNEKIDRPTTRSHEQKVVQKARHIRTDDQIDWLARCHD